MRTFSMASKRAQTEAMMRRIDERALMRSYEPVLARVKVPIGKRQIQVTISRSRNGRPLFFAWALVDRRMILNWDHTAGRAYRKTAVAAKARLFGRRCKTCEAIVPHSFPGSITGEFYCSVPCYQFDARPGPAKDTDPLNDIDTLLAGLSGELLDECRQELAVALLTTGYSVDTVTPAIAAKFIRRIRKSLFDKYNLVSLSGETGEALESRLGLK